MDETTTPVKPYTQFQLIEMYGVSRNTFIAWIEPHLEQIGELRGRCYTKKQVRIIFELIDPPM